MYYLIKEKLEECSFDMLKDSNVQYVAVLTTREWMKHKEEFDMGIDFEPEISNILSSKAYVNFDSITGTLCFPDRTNFENESKFAFALDEKGIVLIDDSDSALRMVEDIKMTKKWRLPSLERFIYDFLDLIIQDDTQLLDDYDNELDKMESGIINEKEEFDSKRVNDIHGNIRDLRGNYEQLLDLSQLCEDNENNFFKDENLRYFRLYSRKIERLRDMAVSLREYTMQLRDMQKAQLDIKQNRIMTMLTIITTIFFPLTLIAGWYGMNFKYMPELNSPWGYPIIIIISAVIVFLSLLFFKKKKWL